MDIQLLGFLIFLVLVSAFLYINRSQVAIQKIIYPVVYMLLYRTKIGLKRMDSFAKDHPKLLDIAGILGIGVGFIGMIAMGALLIDNFYKMIFVPKSVPGVALVLPFKMRGTFYVPFFYWLISVFILAIVHEFSHGIMARRYGVKIKSSGFAFLAILAPILPAAFVEPDEKQMAKKPARQQLAILAAGAFSNILLAFVILAGLLLIAQPLSDRMVTLTGVTVAGFNNLSAPSPAQLAGISVGEVVQEMNGVQIQTTSNFTALMNTFSPGQTVNVVTNRTSYNITLGKRPTNESQAFIGLAVGQGYIVKPQVEQRYGKLIPAAVIWLLGLFNWLFMLNLGIGLFNFVPIGPVDGGRMLKIALDKYLAKDLAAKIFHFVSFVFLALVLINIAFSFFK